MFYALNNSYCFSYCFSHATVCAGSTRMSLTGLTGTSKEDLVVSLAILALHDGGVEVSAANINSIVKASGNTVAAYWGSLYAKHLAARSIDDMLMKPGQGGGAAPAAAAGGAPAAGGAAAAKKEEKKVEVRIYILCPGLVVATGCSYFWVRGWTLR